MKEMSNPSLGLLPVNLPMGSIHPMPSNTRLDFLPRRTQNTVHVSWAQHQDEVREAQRLRYSVFAQEMGARLPVTLPGHDID